LLDLPLAALVAAHVTNAAVDQEVTILLRPQYFQLKYSPEEQRTRTMEQAASKRQREDRSAAFSWFSWEGNSIDKVVKRNSPPPAESPISSSNKNKKTRNITTLDFPEVAMDTSSPYFLGDATAAKASSSAQNHQQPKSVLVASPALQNNNSYYSYSYNSNADQHENTTTSSSKKNDCPHHHHHQQEMRQ